MSVLEIKRTKSVEMTVALGGKNYEVSFASGAGDRDPSFLTIEGLESFEEAKRFLGCIAAGFTQDEKPAPPETFDARKASAQEFQQELSKRGLTVAEKPELIAEPVPEEPKAGAPQSAPKNGGLPAKLVQAERLKDVLSYLAETGVKGEEKVIAECERLKDEVPALKRIPNLAERVKRALVMLDYPAGS